MVDWQLLFTRDAAKDSKNLAAAGLKEKAELLLSVIRKNPFQNPPPFEKLGGNWQGAYSRRINLQHRLVYRVDKKAHVVAVMSLWGHYE